MEKKQCVQEYRSTVSGQFPKTSESGARDMYLAKGLARLNLAIAHRLVGLGAAAPDRMQRAVDHKSFKWVTGLIILLSILLVISRSAAYAEPGVITGLGTLSCGSFNEQTTPTAGYGQNNLSTAVYSWLQGYFSGLNTVSLIRFGRFADVTSITADKQWEQIVGFCQRNPNRAIFDAAQEVLAALTLIEMCPGVGQPGPPSPSCL